MTPNEMTQLAVDATKSLIDIIDEENKALAQARVARITELQAKSSRSGRLTPDRSIALRNAERHWASDRSKAACTFTVSSDRQIAAYPSRPSSSNSTAAVSAIRCM